MKKWIWVVTTVVLACVTIWEPTRFWLMASLAWIIWNVVGASLSHGVKRQMTVQLDVPSRVTKQSEQALQLRITQRSKWPLFQATLHVRAKHMLSGEVMTERIPLSLGTNDSMQLSLPIDTTHCGAWQFEATTFQLSMGFPFYAKKYVIQTGATMLVWPERLVMNVTSSRQNDDISAVALRQKRTQHETTERLGLRPYRMGDSMKQIHWKLSAKQDELIVEERLEEEPSTLQLYVEKTADLAQYDALLTVMFALLESCQQSSTVARLFVNDTAYEATQLEDIAAELLTGQQANKPTGAYVAIVADEQIADREATVLRLRPVGEDHLPTEFTVETIEQKFARIVL